MKPIQLAGCVIIDEYDRILLIHRKTAGKQQWELPGGKIEQHETPEEAAIRELQEELGVSVSVVSALGGEGFLEGENEFHYSWFHAEIAQGEPKIIETGRFDDLDYFDFEDLPSLSLSANMQVLYEKLATGEVHL
jgi:8-oxo-dGTP diphosphatase